MQEKRLYFPQTYASIIVSCKTGPPVRLFPALNSVTALGRYGRPEEMTAAIVRLASLGASYITGPMLNVDGGYGA